MRVQTKAWNKIQPNETKGISSITAIYCNNKLQIKKRTGDYMLYRIFIGSQFRYVPVHGAIPLISAHTVHFHMSPDLITRGKKINWLNVLWTPYLSYHSFVCKDGKLGSSRMPPKEFLSVPSGYRIWWINLSRVESVINGLWWRNIPMGGQSSLFQLNRIKCLLKSIMHANACHYFIMSQDFPGYSKFWGSCSITYRFLD